VDRDGKGKFPVGVILAAAIAVVAVAAVVWWLWSAPPKPGHLKITASVDGVPVTEGVQVTINGPKPANCPAPCDLELPAGDYHVVGTKPGLQDATQHTTIVAGKENSINLPFETPKPPPPSAGRLVVTANVVGAQITVNEHPTDCVTPCGFDLPAGEYRVAGAKQGYRSDEQTVTIAAGQNPSINLQLTPLSPPHPPPPGGPTVRGLIAQGEKDLLSHQYDSATAAFRQAITLGASGSEAAQAYRDLCLALGPSKKWSEASQACRMAISLNTNDARTHSELGVALANLRDWAGAEAEDRAALKLDPTNARLHANLAIILRAEDKQAEAANELKRAHELDPQRYAP